MPYIQKSITDWIVKSSQKSSLLHDFSDFIEVLDGQSQMRFWCKFPYVIECHWCTSRLVVYATDHGMFCVQYAPINTSLCLLGTDSALDLGCCADHVDIPPRLLPTLSSPDGPRIASLLTASWPIFYSEWRNIIYESTSIPSLELVMSLRAIATPPFAT